MNTFHTTCAKVAEPKILRRFDMSENVVADVMATRFGNFSVLVVDLDAPHCDSLFAIKFFDVEELAVAHASELSAKALCGPAVELPVVYA